MKIVLLDRDGTVIMEPPDERVDKVNKIHLFLDTIEALKYLADHGFAAIFITNQAGIAEGRLTAEDFEEINRKVINMLAPSGIQILRTYMSAHGSDESNDWRKPGPGMLVQAATDFNLDLSKTFMVGDRLTDVQAGKSAGAKTILVKTALVNQEAPQADYTAPTLMDAVKYVVSQTPA
jgi:histidinol-phosphate phosphatase family protein